MMNMLRNMDPETMTSYVINMNSFSDAPSLQPTIEAPLEKKSGVRFGPPGAKSLVYFVDDMNMPFVDKYDTQSAIEIMRQYVDYGGWYDKVKIVLKDVVNCQLMGAMNPTAGSFQITPRMQRHFVTFGIVVRIHKFLLCCGHDWVASNLPFLPHECSCCHILRYLSQQLLTLRCECWRVQHAECQGVPC